MRILRIPAGAAALILDLDNTLYTHPAYAAHQETSQVARLARHLGLPVSGPGGAETLLARARRARADSGLPKTSLANHYLELGVPMADIVRWRVEEIVPARWLSPDPALAATLSRLRRRFRLALLTNNPASVGRESLRALGVEALIETVTGLDDTGRSKPSPEPFLAACASLGLPPEACISVGDREDVDCLPALVLGMGAVLVDGPADLAALADLLAAASAP